MIEKDHDERGFLTEIIKNGVYPPNAFLGKLHKLATSSNDKVSEGVKSLLFFIQKTPVKMIPYFAQSMDTSVKIEYCIPGIHRKYNQDEGERFQYQRGQADFRVSIEQCDLFFYVALYFQMLFSGCFR